jgi:hypothetical protein
MTVNVDFDGTCTTQSFPKIGKNIGAEKVLRELVANGHDLILFTIRWDCPNNQDNNYLTQAVNWFKDNNIELYGIQRDPEQVSWTTSPKSCAQLMIDDSAIGCPLKIDSKLSLKPFADWDKIRELLIEKGLIR